MTKVYSKSTRVLYEGEKGKIMQADFIGHTDVNLIGNGTVMAIEDNRQRMLIPVTRLVIIVMLSTEAGE